MSTRPPNIVFLMTDTQGRDMVGAYGNRKVDTPNLDALAASGVRFNRCYTACPLCTPARGAIFSGMHPSVNGAYANNLAPHADVALWGTIFAHYGYQTAYTGKWHLDGAGYFGDGEPGGGFAPDWWYDGKSYADELGPDRFSAYRHKLKMPDDLRRHGFDDPARLWGHRVADRALDFLDQVEADRPFLLVASFDEPHGPFVCPPEYWENAPVEAYTKPKSFGVTSPDKPQRQQEAAARFVGTDWEAFRESRRRFYGCNAWIDRELGRVLDAVTARFGDNTIIVYTSDHGDMGGCHGLTSKGPEMYEETTNVPLLVRTPGGPTGGVSDALVSHVDLLPTLLDYAGIEAPPRLHGQSLRTAWEDPTAPGRTAALLSYERFAINHDMQAGFYPIRAWTDGRWKLVVNLFDTDELYDLQTDPDELTNRIGDDVCADVRDELHDGLLREMNRIRDPRRNRWWMERPWRQRPLPADITRVERRAKPRGFPFQPMGIEAH